MPQSTAEQRILAAGEQAAGYRNFAGAMALSALTGALAAAASPNATAPSKTQLAEMVERAVAEAARWDRDSTAQPVGRAA
jgi:hypothetical protein